MADLKANLGMYTLKQALEADRPTSGCFVLDVGHDEEGNPVKSLKHVIEVVDEYLVNVGNLSSPFTKLYVIGDWNITLGDDIVKLEDSGAMRRSMHEVSIYFCCSVLHCQEATRREIEVLTGHKLQDKTQLEQEWYEAFAKMSKLIEHMSALKELT